MCEIIDTEQRTIKFGGYLWSKEQIMRYKKTAELSGITTRDFMKGLIRIQERNKKLKRPCILVKA